MNRLDSPGLQCAFQPQIEIRRIHADKHIGRVLQQAVAQGVANTQNLAVTPQQLPAKPMHRQFVMGPPGVKTLPFHLGAADATGSQITPSLFESP